MTTPKQLAAFIADRQNDTLEEVQKEGYFKEMESLDRVQLEIEIEKEFKMTFTGDEGVNADSTVQSLTTAINAKTH